MMGCASSEIGRARGNLCSPFAAACWPPQRPRTGGPALPAYELPRRWTCSPGCCRGCGELTWLLNPGRMARPGALIGSYAAAGPAFRSPIGPSGRPCHSPNRLLGRPVGHASKSSYKLPRQAGGESKFLFLFPAWARGACALPPPDLQGGVGPGVWTFFVLAPHDRWGEPEVRSSSFPKVIPFSSLGRGQG